ncbi:uncharacterized protein ATNIH1004_006422 [Aspergillus tanneri]|uniref:Uncharacterized protein n=1 Tax=Aspergillus tanneri TaxID=1220188 RepID=A0A5M9ML38_9EURO|nr:uncharacterized protein ATNIH1004_006422 [Aspergillus tanneri]KAA8647725.1 hypothetical protein ATNIH1004_006422 [Aspergillus tanneri]
MTVLPRRVDAWVIKNFADITRLKGPPSLRITQAERPHTMPYFLGSCTCRDEYICRHIFSWTIPGPETVRKEDHWRLMQARIVQDCIVSSVRAIGPKHGIQAHALWHTKVCATILWPEFGLGEYACTPPGGRMARLAQIMQQMRQFQVDN